ncbi:MAG: SbcC/MukB-like Walker B domain-containing protein, partial [Gaiellales bacterium]
TAARFLRFLLDDRRRALADLASEPFGVLTGGRYRFDESGEFQVIDLTAAESVRAPASLSGGETFLASLALALALAEVVSREGGRLDAFFLDEGFGSLDPEHLDLAMDGVERLVTSVVGRLVVVVSHVPAMAERIEDLIVLDRDPVTGNTVVTSGSGPS